jgi:histidine triad (HIT) family protein
MVTIFEKIIKGDIPCHKVYEDDHVLAFLDVAPLSKGHTLVIPKQTVASLHELTDESGAAIGSALVKISKAVMKATGATAYNVLQNNGVIAHQAVFHVHFHIIPRYTEDDGLLITWNPNELTDGETLAKEIKQVL